MTVEEYKSILKEKAKEVGFADLVNFAKELLSKEEVIADSEELLVLDESEFYPKETKEEVKEEVKEKDENIHIDINSHKDEDEVKDEDIKKSISKENISNTITKSVQNMTLKCQGVKSMSVNKNFKSKVFGNGSEAYEKAAEFGNFLNKSISSSPNISGGATVPIEFSADIQTMRLNYGVLAKECFYKSMTSDTYLHNVTSAVPSVSWLAAGQTVSESDPQVNNVEVVARVQRGLIKMNNDTVADSLANLGAWAAQQLAISHAYTDDNAIANGDGGVAYGNNIGIRTKLAAATTTSNFTSAATAYSGVTITDFENTQGKTKNYMGFEPKWYMSKSIWYSVAQRVLVQTGAQPNQIQMLEGREVPIFLGRPVIFTEVLPQADAIATDKLVAIYGDLKQAVVFGDREGLEIRIDPYTYLAQYQTGMLSFRRCGLSVYGVTDFIDAQAGTTSAGAVAGLILT